jgi:high-affinity iron transporter
VIHPAVLKLIHQGGFTEAGVLPNSEALHRATEPYGPDGEFGRHASVLLVVLPLGWLAIATLRR